MYLNYSVFSCPSWIANVWGLIRRCTKTSYSAVLHSSLKCHEKNFVLPSCSSTTAILQHYVVRSSLSVLLCLFWLLKVKYVIFGISRRNIDIKWLQLRLQRSLSHRPSLEVASELQWAAHANLDTTSPLFFACFVY